MAPTGSGKTLAAFLSAIDSLASAPPPPEPKRRCRVLYISPLKALGVDVERNLAVPWRASAPRASGSDYPNRRSGSGCARGTRRRPSAARSPTGRRTS
ncbi:hypothetical protein GCM10029992_14090 [Glycomyces albus]